MLDDNGLMLYFSMSLFTTGNLRTTLWVRFGIFN